MTLEHLQTALTDQDALWQLAGDFDGRLILPGDPDYDHARTIFYGGYDRRPLAIARPDDAAGVARVVTFARERGLELAVRSGGHSFAGHSVSEGGIVLDLSHLKSLEIDVTRRTAWAGAGLTAGEVTSATAEHGLAVGFGDTGSVGIGGITLGGGIGFLVRKHGLTIDALLAAEIVTAGGQQLRVDRDSHPDLFWAIRGGGGNFGVVTRFKYRLFEVDRVLGGILVLPATPQVIAGFVAAARAAPDELTTIANVMIPPPAPFLPEAVHGQLIFFTMLCYAAGGDDLDEAQRAVAPFRALAEPIVDMVRPMSYPDMFLPEDDGEHPVAVARALFLDEVDEGVAQTILDHLNASDAPVRMAQLRVLGGAISRVPNEATAFAHRDRPILANVAALLGDPGERSAQETWVTSFAAALQQGRPGAYANFMGREDAGRVRQAYPAATYQRLAAVKRRYDPTNLFSLTQNIPPQDVAEGL